MTWFDGMPADPIWIVAGIALAVHGLAFFLVSIGQRRVLDRKLVRLEGGFRKALEEERSQLENRLRELAERQGEGLESLRNCLAENRLRSLPRGFGSPEARLGTPLEKRHRVVSLAQMGFDSRDIARKLRLSRGETELLLGLSERLAFAENNGDGTP